MKSFVKRHPILIIFLSYLCWKLLIVPALNYHGMCVDEFRWISEEEKIRAAVEYVNSVQQIYVNEPIGKVRGFQPRVNYASVEEFLKANPNCCEVVFQLATGNNAFPTVLDQLMGSYSGTVILKFDGRYYDENREIKTQKESVGILINNCGKPWDF